MVAVKINWVQIEDPDGGTTGLTSRCYIRKDRQESPLFTIDIDRNHSKVMPHLYLRKNPNGEWAIQDDVPAELLSEYVEVMGIAKAKLDAENVLEEELNAMRRAQVG